MGTTSFNMINQESVEAYRDRIADLINYTECLCGTRNKEALKISVYRLIGKKKYTSECSNCGKTVSGTFDWNQDELEIFLLFREEFKKQHEFKYIKV